MRNFYARTHNAKHKFSQAKSPEEFKRLMDMEVSLWHDNDIRTWAYTSTQFLTFDNCKVRVDLPVWHVSAKADHFFDNNLVEQHMRVVFNSFSKTEIDVKTHAPSVIADEKEAAALIPPKLSKQLTRLSK